MVEPERLLTPEEVAELLQLKPNTVRMFLREGRITGVKMGKGRWRVRPEDLNAYVASLPRNTPKAAR